MSIVQTSNKSPYIGGDDTREWAEQYRKNGKIKPNLVLRIATDTNYVMDQYITLPAYGSNPVHTRAVMNVALPGMRIPHVLNWSVNESIDQPVQTANFEMLNALSVSSTTTTLTSSLAAEHHSRNIISNYVADSEGVVKKLNGNLAIEHVWQPVDLLGIPYRESGLKYRLFEHTSFTVADASGFPDPAIPSDEDGLDVQNTYGAYLTGTGVGNYFILIDQEIIRVSWKSGNTFAVLPGGRAVNGILQAHSSGAPVTLLGYGSWAGEVTGLGYLTTDDFKPYKNLLRPGTCIVSYEGYGDFETSLKHEIDHTRNYIFTGYWFVKGTETSLGEDGVGRVRVDLVSAGELLNKQKITPDLIQRVKVQYGQWRLGGQSIFGAANHIRNIPGDWVDYHNWDPSLKDSYPVKIKTEFAQHKEFFDHMRESNLGLECEFCMQERKEFLKTHPDPDKLRDQYNAMSPGDAKDRLGQRIADIELLLARHVGRHIYKQSIRVLQDDEGAGPIKTYIRLMATLAAAAWDHPAYGVDLAQRFTKFPNRLYDNMRNVHTGLIYNGSVDFSISNKYYDWSSPGYIEEQMLGNRREITCPFESSYDKAPFYQPMTDLAEVNGNIFWIDREGRPCFMPPGWPMRPFGYAIDFNTNNKQRWQWNLKYGASISAYSHSISTDSVVTQCWVTATTAFDSEFTVASAGTGYKTTGERVIYSPIAGNKEGLALTGGVQQVETISMENQLLGLDWNTKPENFGIKQQIDGEENTMVLNARPTMYDGSPAAQRGSTGTNAIKRVQRTVNFFLIRRYLAPIAHKNKFWYTIYEDGIFGELTEKAVVDLLKYIRDHTPAGQTPSDNPELAGKSGASSAALQGNIDGKAWGRGAFIWTKNYVDKIAENFIKTDIWWYVHNGRTWEEYVGAITGINVPVKSTSPIKRKSRYSKLSLETPLYTIDELGLQREVDKWQKNFTQQAVNVGNRVVDDSINKSTVRSLTCNYADPRIQPGDVLWCEVPGHLAKENVFGRDRPPYTNGISVVQISRQMDLLSNTYTATYSGFRYRGDFRQEGFNNVNKGFDFLF